MNAQHSTQSIAVVGSGISGLAAAWLLSKRHHVTLYESGDHLGGHTNTRTVETGDGTIPVDTGFIVFNPPNYPNLTALFDRLGVKTHPADMSFALTFAGEGFEYSGSDLNGFFGQRRNIFDPGHWQLLAEIKRFFHTSQARIAAYPDHISLGAFLAAETYSKSFIERHIVPMGAAIWSSPMAQMLDFPAKAFIDFYANHAMLRFFGRGKWRTVTGGARTYVEKLIADSNLVGIEGGVKRIIRRNDMVMIEDRDGVVRRYDQVIVATHADQALELLSEPDALETAYLGAFAYQRNRAVLHRDPRFMPKRRRLWSAWNYLKTESGTETGLCVTYWMNALQALPTRTDLFVTLNPPAHMHPKLVEQVIDYAHPVFDHTAIRTQQKLWALQGRRNTWFAGAYFGYGFHEDGLQSGLAVAEALGGVSRPWTLDNPNGRIAPLTTPDSRHQFVAAE